MACSCPSGAETCDNRKTESAHEVTSLYSKGCFVESVLEMWCVEIRRHKAELRHLRDLNGSYKLSNFVGSRDQNAGNRNKKGNASIT